MFYLPVIVYNIVQVLIIVNQGANSGNTNATLILQTKKKKKTCLKGFLMLSFHLQEKKKKIHPKVIAQVY